MGSNSHNQIWQSPFMKFFSSQQHFLWFRSQAASTIIFNVLALLIVAIERQWKFTLSCLPLLEKYSSYHSLICMAAIVLFAYNILEFTFRYLHCCYKLSCKFVVNSEEAKQDILRCFNSPGTKGLVTVAGSRRSASPPADLQRRTPSLLDSVYLPSAAAAVASAKPSNSPSSPSSPGAAVAGGVAARYRQSPTTPPHTPCWAADTLAQYGSSGPSPGRPTYGGGADFSHLARLRYQMGTPSPGGAALQHPGSPVAASPQQQQQAGQQSQQPASNPQHQFQAGGSGLLPPQATLRTLLGVPELDRRWLQGIRTWLHGTILEPLSRDVERVNARLLRDPLQQQALVVGSASPQQLAAGAPSAAQLLPYLAVCEDQGYLVRRLGELASSPCLGAFRWDSGSPGFWQPDRHPSDAQLVMQLLAAYLDRCLPPLPSGAKPFSSVYLLSSRPSCQDPHLPAAGVADLRIVQASRQPPHYQLAMSQNSGAQSHLVLMDLPPGSRNLLACLLLFFHHHYTRGGGRLGHLKLGESGLNLAWIFEAGDRLDIEALLAADT